MTLESTPAQKKAFSTFYAGQKDGTGKPPSDAPDGGPRASKLHAGVGDLLAGKPAPSATDQPDAPAGVDSDVWAKAQASAADPQSPDYDLASALLVVAQQLADLKGSRA
jgi:hypothetical protein